MLRTKIVFCFDIQNNLCAQHVLPMFSPCCPYVLSLEFSCTELVNSTDNLLSYCGLVNARISTSEKDLPVLSIHFQQK